MLRTSDGLPHAIYRVNVNTDFGFYRVNVKAESPTAAGEWVLSYPGLARVRMRNYGEITAAYKLRRQPVWLGKAGTLTARFQLVSADLY